MPIHSTLLLIYGGFSCRSAPRCDLLLTHSIFPLQRRQIFTVLWHRLTPSSKSPGLNGSETCGWPCLCWPPFTPLGFVPLHAAIICFLLFKARHSGKKIAAKIVPKVTKNHACVVFFRPVVQIRDRAFICLVLCFRSFNAIKEFTAN